MIDRRQFVLSTAAAAIAAAGTGPLAAAAPAAPATGGPEDKALLTLLDAFFYEGVDESPENATSLGLDKGARAGLKAKLDDRSEAERTRALARAEDRLKRLRAIDRAKLTPANQINYDVIDWSTTRRVANGRRFFYGNGGWGGPYVLSQLTGAYQDIPDFLDSQHAIATKQDADAYLARLDAFATAIDQDTARQRDNAARGVFAPDFALDLALGQMNALRGRPAAETVLVASIARRTGEKGIAGTWGADAEKIVAGKVFPALDRQMALVKELRARATHDAGVWRLPDGGAYYAASLESSTTTTMSADEIHRIGLTQVAELSAELDAILKGQGMTRGTVGERLAALNADPKQLYPETDEGRAALIASLNADVKHMYGLLPRFFNEIPKATVEIRRVPVFIQDGAPNGYYNGASLDGSRPAIYYINLKETADWPKYTLPSLTYHEAVPGHHLQISLAQESTEIPLIRRRGGFSAYTEGWALYAEQLADELGLYKDDPLGKAGRLQSFLFRAGRLVVDTGIHAKRWSREQATDYLVGVTGMPRPRTLREVERYCVWPGQACSYKVGHNKWVELRARAQARQGSRFDIRTFHDVLKSGAMPLAILEKLVDARIA